MILVAPSPLLLIFIYVLFCSLLESKDTASREQVEGHEKRDRRDLQEKVRGNSECRGRKGDHSTIGRTKAPGDKGQRRIGNFVWCELKENNFPRRQKSMTVTVSCEDTEKTNNNIKIKISLKNQKRIK